LRKVYNKAGNDCYRLPGSEISNKGSSKMKCPVCGANAWHTVVRRDNSKPADRTWVTTLYRVCTKCNYEEKMQQPAENNPDKK
jgi:C4-type Zn-finger protein